MEKWKRIILGVIVIAVYIAGGTWYSIAAGMREHISVDSPYIVLEGLILIDSFVLLWLGLFTMGIPVLGVIVFLLFFLVKYIGLVYWVYWSTGPASLWKKWVVGLIILALMIAGFILNAEWAGFVPGP